MHPIMRHFESLGDNCEFGFVLAAHGINDGGLFRWARIQYFADLVSALDSRMVGSFSFESLSPCAPTMVVDSATGIAFHTRMEIEQDGGFIFSQSIEERLTIHELEKQKFTYLTEKFFSGTENGKKIYVIKSNDEQSIIPVVEALRRHGDVAVLHVVEARPGHPPGTVSLSQPYLYTGFIDRFAPYEKADDISLACWTEICRNAWGLHCSIRGIDSESCEAEEIAVPGPSLPPGFNAQDDLMANPDVLEAGMDAAEHYLNHGWKECRALRL